MRLAIYFDYQSAFEANEIENYFAQGMLAAKFVTAWAFPQLAPN
jgi:hypothetical protein